MPRMPLLFSMLEKIVSTRLIDVDDKKDIGFVATLILIYSPKTPVSADIFIYVFGR